MLMPVWNKVLSTPLGLEVPFFRRKDPTRTSQNKKEWFWISSPQISWPLKPRKTSFAEGCFSVNSAQNQKWSFPLSPLQEWRSSKSLQLHFYNCHWNNTHGLFGRLFSHLFVWDHTLPAHKRLQNSSGTSNLHLDSCRGLSWTQDNTQHRFCAHRFQTNMKDYPQFYRVLLVMLL